LTLLTNGENPIVRLDLLKGKSQTPETMAQVLNEVIDVKGMKAQGNRLSFHTVDKVTLTTEELDMAAFTAEGKATEAPADEKSTEDEEGSMPPASEGISLEITNPDDVKLDNNGQPTLF